MAMENLYFYGEEVVRKIGTNTERNHLNLYTLDKANSRWIHNANIYNGTVIFAEDHKESYGLGFRNIIDINGVPNPDGECYSLSFKILTRTDYKNGKEMRTTKKMLTDHNAYLPNVRMRLSGWEELAIERELRSVTKEVMEELKKEAVRMQFKRLTKKRFDLIDCFD